MIFNQVHCVYLDLSKPTYALVPCWMPKPSPIRNECTGWFALVIYLLSNDMLDSFCPIPKCLATHLLPPPHLTLKPGKAPSVVAKASGYPNAPTRTCFGDFQVCLG